MPLLPHIVASLRQRAKRYRGDQPFPPSADPFAPMKPPHGKPSEINQRLDDLLRSYTLAQIVEMPQKIIEGYNNNRRTAKKIKDLARERLGALKQ